MTSSGNVNHIEVFDLDPKINKKYLEDCVEKIIMRWSKFSIIYNSCPRSDIAP